MDPTATTIQQIRELAAQGGHDLMVRAVNYNPRRYQAVCKDCDWRSQIGTGTDVDREALMHAEATTPDLMQSSVVQPEDPIAEVEIEGEPDVPSPGIEALEERFRKLVPSKERFRSYVPRQMDGSTDYAIVRKAALAGRQPILLMSDAGAGKNHLTEALAADLECPMVSISLSADAQTEDIVGSVGPQTKDGVQFWAWVDGYLTDFARLASTGQYCIIVWDEINAAQPGITFRLHQTFDHRRTLVLAENHETIVAGPRLIHIATMNPDYRGTKPLNQALKRRFSLKLTLDYNTEVERQLLRRRGATMMQTEKLLKLAGQLRKSYHDTDLTQPLGTADLLDYVENSRLLGETIARHSLLQNYEADERASVQEAISLNLDGQMTSASDIADTL
jgi:MoxR-like ATPase